MTTLTLIPPADFINANQRLHHHAKAKLTKAWRELAYWNAFDYRIRHEMQAHDRAHITFAIRFPTNHRRDVGNYYGTAKACLDGLVDAQLLPDDSDEHVVGPDMRRIRPNGTPLVVITITELDKED